MCNTNVTTFYHTGCDAVIKGEMLEIEQITGKIYAIVKWYDPTLNCFVKSYVHQSNVLDVEEVESK